MMHLIDFNKKADHFWIIGGGLMQVPLINEARKLGLKIIVSDKDPKCVCASSADIFFPIDTIDIQSHVDKALYLKSLGMKIKGVLAAGIDAPITMAVTARVLGLPGVDPEIAYTVHNKALFRLKMKELGYPVPKFAVISSEKEAPSCAKKIGFPLIVKNTDSSGSRGTKIFRKPDIEGLKKIAKQAIKVSKSKTAIMEELWEGPEQTVEMIFDAKGNPHRCFITDRHFDLSKGFAIETGLRQPTALSKKVQDQLYTMVERFAKDLGIKIGSAKADTMVTKNGPRFIEFTVRLSGGFDSQYLVPAATGKNVLKAIILTSLGKTFSLSLLKDNKGRIGVTGSIWPSAGKITRISGLDKASRIPGIEKIIMRYKVGDKIEPYIDCTKRVCFIIATGKDEKAALKTLKQAQDTIDLGVK